MVAQKVWMFEKLGLAYDVRWPNEDRLAARAQARAVNGGGESHARMVGIG